MLWVPAQTVAMPLGACYTEPDYALRAKLDRFIPQRHPYRTGQKQKHRQGRCPRLHQELYLKETYSSKRSCKHYTKSFNTEVPCYFKSHLQLLLQLCLLSGRGEVGVLDTFTCSGGQLAGSSVGISFCDGLTANTETSTSLPNISRRSAYVLNCFYSHLLLQPSTCSCFAPTSTC